VGYRSTNKKDYIKQMTKWLTRQEKIYRFDTYLQWALPGYRAEAVAISDSDENMTKTLTNAPINPGEQAAPSKVLSDTTVPQCHYSMPKVPSYRNVSVESIETDFGAVNFLSSVETYLRKLGHPIPHVPSTTKFDLFKRMYVWIPATPQVTQQPTKDTILATCPEVADGVRKKPVPGQFSTALMRESEAKSDEPLDGEQIRGLSIIALKTV
jgi:hypothetical protein